jgi:hypothetical protein
MQKLKERKRRRLGKGQISVLEKPLQDERLGKTEALTVAQLLDLFADEAEHRCREVFQTIYGEYDFYVLKAVASSLRDFAQYSREQE